MYASVMVVLLRSRSVFLLSPAWGRGRVRGLRTPPPTPSPKSERAPDQFLHDLVRAAVDLLHPRVGVEPRDRVFPHVTVAAEELQALVDQRALQVGGEILGHRR